LSTCLHPTSLWRRRITPTRTSVHVVFAVIIWPGVTILGATAAILNLPYFSVSVFQALAASIGGTLLSGPDMLVTGGLFFGTSLLIFRRFGRETWGRRVDTIHLLLEPLLAVVAIGAGAALWYPAVVGHPVLIPIQNLAVGYVVLVLFGAVVLGACIVAKEGARLRLALVLIGIGVISPVPLAVRSALEPFLGHRADVIILGVDSVSYDDTYPPFRDWVNRRGGTWYEHAVTPGLLTNSVWASILTMQPVRDHGVFHTFQPLPSAPPAFISSARANGYRTVSVFTDQFTCAVGSLAGFDVDQSGPIGWRQLLLSVVADNSLLLPILKPALPHIWLSPAPPNHAGTFTYDVRREIRGILRAGTRQQRTLVVAHVNYAHHPAYPSSRDLSWSELWQVARAPAVTIRDRSFDWQDRDKPSDPLKLHSWKLRHLHEVIASEIDASRHLENAGHLVLFSDHGDRAGLSVENFADERYYHVPLATFGIPPRCPREPISLIDIGTLVGLSEVRATTSVEFTLAPQAQWSSLLNTARLRWSGDVALDQGILTNIFRGLRRYDSSGVPDGRACLATASRR
jgi:hypothetical protein